MPVPGDSIPWNNGWWTKDNTPVNGWSGWDEE
jgi:hypothetical protein